ncbi:hypothetical protein GCM10027187_39650 [Streptosporangium sandarakinum]|uniref:Fructose-specific phosphotransferase system IIC component n=1 Tax=Streptosporangium sandarakinum TaxID=1260955 RepID=A0A852VBV8_9ACTN|nr:hypothetical protein [Streptosporangium sandarakinum]NYF44544.1 fructose-specific phosphotransferase system IIC component [Streptosporangium sandarakinum]
MSVSFMIWLVVFVGLPLSASVATGDEATPAQVYATAKALTPYGRLVAAGLILYALAGGLAYLVRENARILAYAAAAAAVIAAAVLAGIASRLALIAGTRLPALT